MSVSWLTSFETWRESLGRSGENSGDIEDKRAPFAAKTIVKWHYSDIGNHPRTNTNLDRLVATLVAIRRGLAALAKL